MLTLASLKKIVMNKDDELIAVYKNEIVSKLKKELKELKESKRDLLLRFLKWQYLDEDDDTQGAKLMVDSFLKEK